MPTFASESEFLAVSEVCEKLHPQLSLPPHKLCVLKAVWSNYASSDRARLSLSGSQSRSRVWRKPDPCYPVLAVSAQHSDRVLTCQSWPKRARETHGVAFENKMMLSPRAGDLIRTECNSYRTRKMGGRVKKLACSANILKKRHTIGLREVCCPHSHCYQIYIKMFIL